MQFACSVFLQPHSVRANSSAIIGTTCFILLIFFSKVLFRIHSLNNESITEGSVSSAMLMVSLVSSSTYIRGGIP